MFKSLKRKRSGDDRGELDLEQTENSSSPAHQGCAHSHCSPVLSAFSSRYAITFGETAILHIGGKEFGAGRRDAGFSVSELGELGASLPHSELIMLSDALPKHLRAGHQAGVLVLREGAQTILQEPDAALHLWREQENVEYDCKFFDRGRTKNKVARHNIVFGEKGQQASEDYRECTVKAFSELPWLARFRASLSGPLGAKAANLNAEGNHYYTSTCGIGFHGDSERKVVVCLSLGAASTLRYCWRAPRSSDPFGKPIDIRVQHGDVYVMSEKATGFDWRNRSQYRLVHAAGAAKYIK